MVRHYQASKLGSGDGIDWQTGNWGDMPMLIIESFAELSAGLQEGMEYKSKSDQGKRDLKGLRGHRRPSNPNRSKRRK